MREGGVRQEGEDHALQPPGLLSPSSLVRWGQAAAAGLSFAWSTSHTQESQPDCSITQKASAPMAVLTPW